MPSLLETFLLISAARAVGAKSIFEFGTCRGATSLNLAMNTDAQIYTLDLDQQIEHIYPTDKACAEVHLANLNSLDFIGTEWDSRVTVLNGNSREFDFSPYRSQMDMCFIDGGHDYHTVASDTESAFRMVAGKKRSCIAWHDYRHPDNSGNTYLIDSVARERTIWHIEETVLCLWFSPEIENVLTTHSI